VAPNRGEQMALSAVRQFFALLIDHRDRLMQAAQADWHTFQHDLHTKGEVPDHRDTEIGRLGSVLKPFDRSGEFFKHHDAAVRECAVEGQFAAFAPLFERIKYAYWRCWERARESALSPDRPGFGDEAFGELSRHTADFEDFFPALGLPGANDQRRLLRWRLT
jgi:hypothetical protein